MNSYAKFGGAARRRVSAICEKPMGGHICAPPAVRGLKEYLSDAASCDCSYRNRYTSQAVTAVRS